MGGGEATVSTHPYWAYKAVPGSLDEEQEREAVDEGRRAFALERATQWDDTVDGQLEAARRFEEYLKGGGGVAEVRLLGLQEAGGRDEE